MKVKRVSPDSYDQLLGDYLTIVFQYRKLGIYLCMLVYAYTL